ncbi:MAG: transcription termination/antitermination protein NusG [Deferribacteraceae bacterium]|jgi:transcriptional antiterminator NusG|nr:transcription termination/antitermination protein NusG [Deferribacteraceae bacterium]
MPKQWYVVHTYSGFERRVKTLLEKKIDDLSLQDEIGEVLIPTEDVVELRKGKKHVSKKKTFPGYILVNMNMDINNWHIVKSIPKVTGFVGGQSPFPVPESDVKAIMDLAREQAPRNVSKYVKGDHIEVVDGPFSSFEGIVDEVNTEREKVRVIVTIFGRQTPLELDYLQIKRK